ncbi:MAG TPA: hypothetical protein VD931_16515 [Baekduia sp.]|nr:hypothetical protein [Baekduia sp.]
MTADVARERRGNRVAGVAAMLSVAGSFAALLLLVSTTTADTGDDDARRSLLEADQNATTLWAAVGARVLSALLIALVGWRLVVLVRHRVDVPKALGPLAIAAPVGLALSALLGHLSLIDAADAFTSGGPMTEARAEDLLSEGGLQRLAAVLGIVLGVVFAGWLAWVSLAGLRAGLFTTTLGYWGAGAGLASVLLPLAGQGLLLGWLGSLGLLLLGWWPGGLGPSWTTGEPVPWQPVRGRPVGAGRPGGGSA